MLVTKEKPPSNPRLDQLRSKSSEISALAVSLAAEIKRAQKPPKRELVNSRIEKLENELEPLRNERTLLEKKTKALNVRVERIRGVLGVSILDKETTKAIAEHREAIERNKRAMSELTLDIAQQKRRLKSAPRLTHGVTDLIGELVDPHSREVPKKLSEDELKQLQTQYDDAKLAAEHLRREFKRAQKEHVSSLRPQLVAEFDQRKAKLLEQIDSVAHSIEEFHAFCSRNIEGRSVGEICGHNAFNTLDGLFKGKPHHAGRLLQYAENLRRE